VCVCVCDMTDVDSEAEFVWGWCIDSCEQHNWGITWSMFQRRFEAELLWDGASERYWVQRVNCGVYYLSS